MKERGMRKRADSARTGLVAEIISGISEKEMVITHPDESIRDGPRVRQRRTGR
jgi:hypothetical protein